MPPTVPSRGPSEPGEGGRASVARDYPSPKALLERHGLRPKKSWGQNFLCDPGALEHIAELASPGPGEAVVELGAGLGHLSARLWARGAAVVAVERDRDMARVLRAELGEKILVLEADAARLDWPGLAARYGRPETPAGRPRLLVVGNLPYHLTSPILFALLETAPWLSRAVFLVQREVAERLAAAPGARGHGLLSVLLQRQADVEVARRVPPGAFWPPPRVESAVLCARFRPPEDPVIDEGRFRALVKAGFGQRRKTLRNALQAARVATAKDLDAALTRAGLDPARRGESLSLSEWAALERALGPTAASNNTTGARPLNPVPAR
ncbi:MAG TPA: 16S rRNA (adenine(1518)-N(6)/adenine(1519)-N(6))-dimethyltransferase RsmA [Anaeromyxobacter sp.]|nr:16S rRNA (adenine(1518)-N(6)/adenine(1519)-N(6))-dimethyltransferase RsmA [Anaeromyxobacter sp.]